MRLIYDPPDNSAEHEGHDLVTATVGAPGHGTVVWCRTCNEHVSGQVYELEISDVI